jgi:hypothetical protein
VEGAESLVHVFQPIVLRDDPVELELATPEYRLVIGTRVGASCMR